MIGATAFCFSPTDGLSGDFASVFGDFVSVFGDFASALMVVGDFFSVLTGLDDFFSFLDGVGDFFSVFMVAFGVFFCFSDDLVVLVGACFFCVGVFLGDGLFTGDVFSCLITSRTSDFSRFFGGDLLHYENGGFQKDISEF